MELFVTYDEYCAEVIEDDGEQYGWRHDRYEASIERVYADREEFSTPYYESFEVECDEVPEKVYVVYARYSTGSTFGRSEGRLAIEGVYLTRDEAKAVVKSVNDGKYKGYAPWEGYFETLESIDWESFEVR